jgi:hypothetical protein
VKRHSALLAALVAFLLLVTASAASAATTHYASKDGTGTAPCTDSGHPCLLTTAVGTAGVGDKVSVAPGTYAGLPGVATLQNGVEIAGQPDAAKPVLQSTIGGVNLMGANDTLRHVAIETSGLGAGVSAGSGATVSDVDVTASGSCVAVSGPGVTIEDSKLTLTTTGFGSCISAFPPLGDNFTIRNVGVKSTAPTASPVPTALVNLLSGGAQVDRLVVDNPKGPAVQIASGIFLGTTTPSVMRRSRLTGTNTTIGLPALTVGSQATVTDTLVQAGGTGATPTTAIQATGGKLRNVTAIATGTGSRGLQATSFLGPTPANTSVKNSILRGDGADVAVDPSVGGIASPPGCTIGTPGCIMIGGIGGGDLTINKSNFRTSTGTLNAASGGNQTADPMFTNAAAGDFHPQAGSPAIDAGTDDADNGTKDLDGNDRKLGSAVDMGAYEFVPPAPPAQQQPSAPANTGEPANIPAPVVVDLIAPTLGNVAITNKTFKVGKGATAVAARAKTGTVFVYSLTEPGAVSIAIQIAQPGKRQGSSCVKPTRKLRKAKKCTYYKTVGTLTRGGIGGTNAVPFSGRIGTKALKPGSYRAVFSAVDLAGNKSVKTPSVNFKIVKK